MKTPMLILLALSLLLPFAAVAQDEAKVDLKAEYEAGKKAEAQRDFKKAVEHYDRIMDVDEEYEDVYDRWDACQGLIGWQEELEGEPKAIDLVRLGERYLELSRFKEEKASYEEAIALDPKCRDAHGHLALWHYASGESEEKFKAVYPETLLYMETSPYAADLKESIADFKLYGSLRNLRAMLGKDYIAGFRAGRAKKYAEAAALYMKEAARTDIETGPKMYTLSKAGAAYNRAGNLDAARKAFGQVLAMPPCQVTQQARLYLATMETKAGNLAKAIEHLKAAVAEGSSACRAIESRKDKAFKPLFTADDESIRNAVEELTDAEKADAPLRKAIADAKAKAGKEGKKVLIHWYGPYCPYVMAMQERLVHPEVKALIEKHYVYVRVDQGQVHRAVSLNDEYGDVMNQHGVPCFLVLGPDDIIPSVQKDLSLMEAEHRSYSVELIVEFLNEYAE